MSVKCNGNYFSVFKSNHASLSISALLLHSYLFVWWTRSDCCFLGVWGFVTHPPIKLQHFLSSVNQFLLGFSRWWELEKKTHQWWMSREGRAGKHQESIVRNTLLMVITTTWLSAGLWSDWGEFTPSQVAQVHVSAGWKGVFKACGIWDWGISLGQGLHGIGKTGKYESGRMILFSRSARWYPDIEQEVVAEGIAG